MYLTVKNWMFVVSAVEMVLVVSPFVTTLIVTVALSLNFVYGVKTLELAFKSIINYKMP